MTEAVDQPDAAERRVIAAVKGLRAMQGVSVAELCELLHFSRGTWFARMNDGQFTVGEVARLAQRFGVKVQAIVDGVAYSQADDVRATDRDDPGVVTRRKDSRYLRSVPDIPGKQRPNGVRALLAVAN